MGRSGGLVLPGRGTGKAWGDGEGIQVQAGTTASGIDKNGAVQKKLELGGGSYAPCGSSLSSQLKKPINCLTAHFIQDICSFIYFLKLKFTNLYFWI